MKRIILWKNRENDLSQFKRYGDFEVMFYRTNLYVHYKRDEALLSAFIPNVLEKYSDFNEKLSKLISKYHDDFELILGDISLQLKLRMNKNELSDFGAKEIAAAEKISSFYHNPKIKGYQYKEILMHAILKDCMEAQLHSFADKIDGYCEAIHEVLAGNLIFLEPIINYHTKIFNDLKGNFPLISEIFEKNKNNLFNFSVVDLKDFFQKGKISGRPHTTETISIKTGIPHYEEWKRVTLSTFSNGIELLTKQVEFNSMLKK